MHTIVTHRQTSIATAMGSVPVIINDQMHGIMIATVIDFTITYFACP